MCRIGYKKARGERGRALEVSPGDEFTESGVAFVRSRQREEGRGRRARRGNLRADDRFQSGLLRRPREGDGGVESVPVA